MKKKFLYIISTLVILVAVACGPAPEPTLRAEDVAGTAAADAWLAVTLTQAAIPTNTATSTPTPTLLPTFTLVPTLFAPPTAVLAIPTTPAVNPCYNPPPPEPKGQQVQIKLVNNSKGLVDLSLGMQNPNNQGECATYFFRLGRYDQTVVTVLAACYWGYAYITDPTSNAQTASNLCLFETSKTVPISIGAEVIGLQ
jgi:hypothetical protein